MFLAEFFELLPRRTATISHKPAFPERPKGADDIPVMLAAGLFAVGVDEAVALFRPRVAEVVVLFSGVAGGDVFAAQDGELEFEFLVLQQYFVGREGWIG